MRRLNLIGLSVLAAAVVVPHASSMQLRIAPSVTIGGAQVPVEAQPRSVIEQEIGVADHGMFHHPEIDDEVLVAFETGNLLRPYLVGSLWDCDAGGRGERSDGDQRCRLLRWPW
jgi:hypothetical protein